MDDYELTALDDSIIEDTCVCQCCGASFVLGGNDDVIVEVPQNNGRVAQLVLCITCAKSVHDLYRQQCEECGVDP